MTNINERLAVVETQIDSIVESADRREEKQDEILVELKETRELLYEIQNEIHRYKGFFGGIVFILSCIGAFLLKFATPIIKMMGIKIGS